MDLVPNEVVSCANAAAGNPFYLGELTAHAARGGDMDTGPKSIRELIEVQCVALTKEAQRVLLVIALFEGRATLPRITSNLGYGSDQFMALLEELEQAGLIAVVEGHLRCKHEFVADTATNVAMESVRSYVRVRIAEQLEEEADESASIELLGDVVEHWEKAAVSQRAFLASMKLGNRLVQLGLGIEADAAFERAALSAGGPAEAIAAFEGGVIACHLSAKWSKAQAVERKKIAVSKSSLGTLRTSTQNALLAAEASMYTLFEAPERGRLHALASDRSQPDALRVRAASILAIWGDNAFEAQAFEDAVSAINDITTPQENSPQYALLMVVYHTVVGDRGLASKWADRLAAIAETTNDYSIRVQGLRRAGSALFRLNEREKAQKLFATSLGLSTRLRLPIQEVACLEILVHFAIGDNDLHSAKRFAAEIHMRNDADPALVQAISDATDAAILWVTGDRHGAQEHLCRSVRITNPPLPKTEQALLAAHLAVEILALGGVRDESEAARLIQLQRLGAGFGDQDFSASVATWLILRGGRTAEANEFEAFLGQRRRELHPYPRVLRVAAERAFQVAEFEP
ncbi:MAG: hypothetical protein JST16_16480 [Bdellovibrionales bacterium]|nr:hypothetical protein [Bdellovibrionales bacterium]